jgi:hypothetical protein
MSKNTKTAMGSVFLALGLFGNGIYGSGTYEPSAQWSEEEVSREEEK